MNLEDTAKIPVLDMLDLESYFPQILLFFLSGYSHPITNFALDLFNSPYPIDVYLTLCN